jgi:rare lipoprotein A
LDFHEQGTVKVRVEILPNESRAIRAAMLGHPEVGSAPVRPVTRSEAVATAGSSGKIYVQAGSFSQSALAQDLGKKLSSAGDVSVTRAVVNGASFYRVRMGPFATEAEASRALDRARSHGVQNARIIYE